MDTAFVYERDGQYFYALREDAEALAVVAELEKSGARFLFHRTARDFVVSVLLAAEEAKIQGFRVPVLTDI